MITLPRPLARQFRALLRRCLQPPAPRELSLIRLQAGPNGVELAARQPECSLVYRQPGSFDSETIVLSAEVLADIAGKAGSVTLAATDAGMGEARWEDAAMPRSRSIDTVAAERMPELPAMPARLKPLGPAFLHALAEAARTTARQGVRYALTRIQLRGSSGQMVATDGRQLLVQGGFSLP
jgi:hypothetical protein